MSRSTEVLTAVAASVVLAGLTPAVAAADNQGGDVVGCAYDRPCFYNVYDAVDDGLVLQWSTTEPYDKFHFQWAHVGGPWHTYDLSGNRRQFVIRHAWKSTEYVFAIQGCTSVLIGKDHCSPYEDGRFTTNNR